MAERFLWQEELGGRAVLWWVDESTAVSWQYQQHARGSVLSVTMPTLQFIFRPGQRFVKGGKGALFETEWEPVDRRPAFPVLGQLAPDFTIVEADVRRLEMHEYVTLLAMLRRVAEYLEGADA